MCISVSVTSKSSPPRVTEEKPKRKIERGISSRCVEKGKVFFAFFPGFSFLIADFTENDDNVTKRASFVVVACTVIKYS